MAEYHVGCGGFGTIYAGTLGKIDKFGYRSWKQRSEVTQEATDAVVQHFAIELEKEKLNELNMIFTFRNGEKYRLYFKKCKEEGSELLQ